MHAYFLCIFSDSEAKGRFETWGASFSSQSFQHDALSVVLWHKQTSLQLSSQCLEFLPNRFVTMHQAHIYYVFPLII